MTALSAVRMMGIARSQGQTAEAVRMLPCRYTAFQAAGGTFTNFVATVQTHT